MTISAKIIADSVFGGRRITTMSCRVPKWLLAELNTHKACSRNAGSSRAIPTERVINQIEDDPFIPVYWGEKQKGMAVSKEIPWFNHKTVKHLWLKGARHAVEIARDLLNFEVHKSITSRILEPYMWVDWLVTMTDRCRVWYDSPDGNNEPIYYNAWENFFNLRNHPAAMPEMQVAARAMQTNYENSTPEHTDTHLPYIESDDRERCLDNPRELAEVSAARCARVSYLNQEGTKDFVKDKNRFNELYENKHLSPMEHQAQAVDGDYVNFSGWKPFRFKLSYAHVT